MTELLGVQDHIEADEEAGFIRVSEQEFDAGYWSGLQWAREQDATQRCPELWRVGSIPAIFVESWLKAGFNVWKEDAKAIVRRCQAEGLTDFLTTGKRV